MPGRAPSIRRFRFTSRFAAALLGLALALPAAAQDLFEVYRQAQSYDAVYQAARHSVDAGRERRPQGLALLLPNLNLTGSATSRRKALVNRDCRIDCP